MQHVNLLLVCTGGSRRALATWYHQALVYVSNAAPCECYATDPSCMGKQNLAHTLHVLYTQPIQYNTTPYKIRWSQQQFAVRTV